MLGEQLGDAHVLLVRGDREQRVQHVAELLAGGLDDRVDGVTDRRDADAGAEVDERVAVDVDHDGAVGALDVDRKGGRDAGADSGLATGVEGDGLRSGDRRDHLTLGGDGLYGRSKRVGHAPSLARRAPGTFLRNHA